MGPRYHVRFKGPEDKTFWRVYSPVYRAQINNGVLFFYEDKNHTKARAFNVGALTEIEIIRVGDDDGTATAEN